MQPFGGRRLITTAAAGVFASLLLIASAACAQSRKAVIDLDSVKKKTLENGMTVLVREDRSAPVAAVNVWVKTGYFNEPDDLTGISHLLEHMYFKGTPTRPVGKIQDEVKAVGGYWNAGTIYDSTNYYITVPAGEIGRAMDIEADALRNSLFDEAELKKESEVVIQEILRKYDNPSALAWEKMIAMSFKSHRFGRWRMGTPEQIRSFTREKLVKYYNDTYRPANIVLVIAGDVDADKVFADAERLFGPMPAGELDKSQSGPEPEQNEMRYSRHTTDVKQAYIEVGFHAPGVLDGDECAVQVLAGILGSGKSSRLFRELKERAGIVNTVGAGYYSLPGVGTLYIEAELDPAKLRDAEAAVFAQLERMRREAPSDEEIERVKTAVEFSFLSSMEDVGQQASSLAYYEALGDYNLLNGYLDNLRAVTAEDVRRAAEKYLAPEMASVLEYLPETAAATAPAESIDEVRAAAGKGAEAGAKPVAVKGQDTRAAAPEQHKNASGTPAPGGVSSHKLSNGIDVVIYERPRLPLVSFAIYFPGGRPAEARRTAGLTRLMLRSSLKGTKTRGAERIQDEIESLGTTIGVSAGADYAAYSFSALSRNLAPALDVLADVVLNPIFPDEEITKEKDSQLAQIRRNQDSMYAYPFELVRGAAFGSHPYGLPVNGREETLPELTRDDLLESYKCLVRPSGALIAVTGDVAAADVLALMEEKFGGMKPDTAAACPDEPIPSFATGSAIVERKKSQTAQAFAFPAPGARSDLVVPLTILRNIASGMGGRLYDQVREKNNLAYTVAAFLEMNKWGGLLMNYAATSPENETAARDMMLDEWGKMASGDISTEEFDAAKAYTLGSYKISMQANDSIRDQIAHNVLMGRGLEYFEKYPSLVGGVTIEQVKSAAASLAPSAGYAIGGVRAEK